MTIVHNTPVRNYRNIYWKAYHQANAVLRKEKTGHKELTRYQKVKADPHLRAAWEASAAENARIGYNGKPRAQPFVGVPRGSRAKMAVALTPSQVADRNRALLAKVVAGTARVDVALKMKAAADAGKTPQHANRRKHTTDGRSI